MIQNFVVTVIVLAIISKQVIVFNKNKKIINQLSTLFPNKENLSLNLEDYSVESTTASPEFQETLDDINAYLGKNQNKSADYNIIKEIVERNSQKIEEDVDTMLSSPLYLGLMATILGAAVGIVSFAWTDLQGLLMGTSVSTIGIQTLLTDIGIAMTASFIGVACTAISTSKFKDAKGTMTKNKNMFLTWVQTNIMPNMTDNLADSISKMVQDLNVFNNTFADNTRELRATLSQVADNYDNQVELLNAIDRIKVNKIAEANIKVYDKLQGCTTEIERLFEHLGKSEQYISKVVELNSKLGDIEDRTQLCEELGSYFKNEIEFVKDRQGMMRQNISQLDSVMQDAFENLSVSLSNSISGLTDVFQRQNQHVQTLIEEQENALLRQLDEQRTVINQKALEFADPFAGIKDTFTEVSEASKVGIEKLSASFDAQNEAINQMLQAQRQMLETELLEHRNKIESELSASPLHVEELVTVINKLNKTVEVQKETINTQTAAIEKLISYSNLETQQPKSKFMKYVLPVAVGSTLFLMFGIFLMIGIIFWGFINS